jgi:hypothetical protein
MVGENGDSFTEVTSQGLGSRLMESIKGVLAGLVMFIAAFPVLFMNEGCAVKTAKGLEEGAKSVIAVKADTVNAANNAKLVHMSGQAVTDEILTDTTFGISQKGIKLIRTVDMYQWKEETKTEKKKKMGGSEETITTYNYVKDWSADRIDSGKFKKPGGHANPGMPYKSQTETARLVKLGAYRLSPSLIAQISSAENLPVQESNLAKLPADIRGRSKIFDSGIYAGKNPSDPQVGDMKIRYSIVKPQMVSLISQQKGDTFEPYKTKTNTEIDRLESGEKSAEAMFTLMQQENVMRTWVVRIVGFILMFMGIGLIFKPISTLGDVVPIVGSILGMGFGVAAFIVAFVLSLITIAIAWIFYRPVLAVILLAVGIAAFAGIWFIAKQKKAKAAPAS